MTGLTLWTITRLTTMSHVTLVQLFRQQPPRVSLRHLMITIIIITIIIITAPLTLDACLMLSLVTSGGEHKEPCVLFRTNEES